MEKDDNRFQNQALKKEQFKKYLKFEKRPASNIESKLYICRDTL